MTFSFDAHFLTHEETEALAKQRKLLKVAPGTMQTGFHTRSCSSDPQHTHPCSAHQGGKPGVNDKLQRSLCSGQET